MEVKELDIIVEKENSQKLANVISDCMIENRMTIKQMEQACESVKNMYKNNAIIVQPAKREREGVNDKFEHYNKSFTS